MRAFLNALYTVAGWLAALCLVAIAVLVGLQILGRIADGLMRLAGYPPYGFLVAGLAEIAGYLLAIASRFALAPTLRAGAHVRVIILLSALSEPIRRIFEMGVLAFAAVFSAYMTWHIGRLAYDSWQFNEVSYGLVPLPLAWPQACMTAGLAILTIALIDEFFITATRGRPTYRGVEEQIALGREG